MKISHRVALMHVASCGGCMRQLHQVLVELAEQCTCSDAVLAQGLHSDECPWFPLWYGKFAEAREERSS